MKTALTPDYRALKAFFAYLSDRWFAQIPLAPAEGPVEVLEKFEKSSPGKATVGLRMAVNDLIEMSSRMKPNEVATLDTELAEAGLMTFTQVRAKYSKRLSAVLKRGVVRNEVDYYLLQSVVTDATSGISEQNRDVAKVLCNQYEAKVSATS